jgi:hypothetical protein
MINEAPLSRFQPFGPALLKPIYADYSFGNIPNTLHYLLTGEKLGPLLPEDCFGGAYPSLRRVVLFFIDAFGWKFWQEHHGRFASMRHVTENGVLTPISALFPSTTAASVSTMNMGVLPAAHSLYEWNVYIPAYGETIQTLPFRPLGPQPRDACLAKGYDPAELLTVEETVHQRLARHGVRSIQLANMSYSDGVYNRISFAGAEVVRHHTLAESFVQLKEALEAVKGPALFNAYWAAIDSIAHHYGPGSPHHIAEIASFWQTFEAVLGGTRAEDTLFLFTADHGQVRGVAEDTIAINERWPELVDCLTVSHTGTLVRPNGSPRDMFLHVKPECRDQVLDTLRANLSGIAEVITVDSAIEAQLFGPGPYHPEFRRRLGDVLVLAHDGHFIWWREPGVLENRFHGHHGGLAPAELISALGVVDGL